MSRRRSCAICGKTIGDDEEVIPYKTRWAHKTCFDSLVQYVTDDKEKNKKVYEKEKAKRAEEKRKEKQAQQTVIKPQIKVSEEEYKEKKATFSLIESLLGEKMKAKHYHILDSYVAKYGFTYDGMRTALEYYYIDRQNSAEGDGILGIIPYIYEDALASAKAIEAAKETNKSILKAQKELYPVHRVISKRRIKPKPKLADISNIGSNADEREVSGQKSHFSDFGSDNGSSRIRGGVWPD